MNNYLDFESLAAIQYMGTKWSIDSCVESIVMLLHAGERITNVKLLTYTPSGERSMKHHCFLISIRGGEIVAIKGAFTSGYSGSGPARLSTALELFNSHEIEVNECFIDQVVFDRVNSSCLLLNDLERLSAEESISPVSRYEYIYRIESKKSWPALSLIKEEFPVEVPLAIVDDRIIDLAVKFKQNPDAVILSGYRRLESIIRNRTGLFHEYGEGLFIQAFVKKDSILYWKDLHPAESNGRGLLFSATYKAYRNHRAHHETDGNSVVDYLREFLLLNELYHLEAASVERLSNEA